MARIKYPRKKPHCKKCYTPMKGHRRNVCRPMQWYDHSTNTEHGGKYEWEKELKPVVVVSTTENQVIVDTGNTIETVPMSQIMQAPPPGADPSRDAFLAPLNDTANESEAEESDSESAPEAETTPAPEPETTPAPEAAPEAETTPEAVAEAEPEKEEWKPLADRYWWNYYTNWQQNSTWVKFPTLMGMSSAQLGDIMENYSKYRNYYYYN